ncbi:hypothetical protein HYZ76_01285 [Candidatus Falkowbacteria bacterium]|nr:hypothetical protein [Candidatus Falkowbacteria bacterium]
MVDRAKEMQAYLGEFDGRHILDHQKEIHPDLWDGNVLFIFPDWRNIVFYDGVSCVHPGLNQWVQEFLWVGRDWYGYARLLRLKSVQTAEVV